MTLLASRAAGPGRLAHAGFSLPWAATAADFCLGAAIAVAAFLNHPFGGITGDAKIYIGRALADLDPDNVGHDLMFRLDGQSGFTIFRPLARWLVAHLGLETATWLLSVAGLLLYSVAIYVCVRTFQKGRALAIVVAAGLMLPRIYSPSGIIAAGEALAIPRPWAEACVLLAVACLAKDRFGAAIALVGLAAVFHPIMALPGAILLLHALCVDNRRWVYASVCGALAVFVAGALGAPIVSRAFTRIDPTWLDILRLRTSYLFVSTWDVNVWSKIVVQAATLCIATRFVPATWSRIFLGTLLVGFLGCLMSFVGVDLLSSLLFAQIQLWRSLWLMAALAPVAAGVCLVAMPRDEWRSKAVLASLAAAWMTPGLAPANAMMALLALGLATFGQSGLGERVYKTACLAAALIIACAAMLNARLVLTLLQVLPSDFRLPTSDLLRFSFAAFCVVGLVWWCATRRDTAVRLCAALLLLTISTLSLVRYDQRTSAKIDVNSGASKPDLIEMLASRPGEVLWLGDDALWYWTRRPSWSNTVQGSGIVFSRELALTWYDRTTALVAAHFGGGDLLSPWKEVFEHPTHPYDARDAAELCHRNDAPAWIVMPLEDNVAAPSDPNIKIWTSPVDERAITIDGERLVLRSASRRLLIPCALDFASP